nr:MAG TPA: hypothetical protein [Caudoviricetes sp.]
MGCCNKIKSDAPRVRMGTDTIFSVVLYRYNGEIGTIIGQYVEEEIDPSTLVNIEAEVLSGGRAEAVDMRINDRLLNIELSKEITNRLGLGLYSLRLKVREVDSRFSDGYRDVTLMTDLCQVVPEGAYTGKPKENVAVVIAQLATGKSAYQLYLDTTTDNPKKTLPEWLDSHKGDKGDSAYDDYLKTTTDNPKKSKEEWLASFTGKTGKSAYQHYLDTTTDEPKMSEQEWATGGWLVFAELLKRI